MQAADLFYYKQFGYAAIPPGLALFIYLIWRSYACVRGLPWRNREKAKTHNNKDKMVVTLCVLLYFFWPSLLSSTFQLFSCRSIGNDGTLYLMADFEEPCFVGRHLWMASIVGVGQILLYALGLPLLVFVFLSRHKHELVREELDLCVYISLLINQLNIFSIPLLHTHTHDFSFRTNQL